MYCFYNKSKKKFWSQLDITFLKIKNSTKMECGLLEYYVVNKSY